MLIFFQTNRLNMAGGKAGKDSGKSKQKAVSRFDYSRCSHGAVKKSCLRIDRKKKHISFPLLWILEKSLDILYI